MDNGIAKMRPIKGGLEIKPGQKMKLFLELVFRDGEHLVFKFFGGGERSHTFVEAWHGETLASPAEPAQDFTEGNGRVRQHAAAGAAALGYFSGDYYSPFYVLCNSIPQYQFGGISSGILNGSPGAIATSLRSSQV